MKIKFENVRLGSSMYRHREVLESLGWVTGEYRHTHSGIGRIAIARLKNIPVDARRAMGYSLPTSWMNDFGVVTETDTLGENTVHVICDPSETTLLLAELEATVQQVADPMAEIRSLVGAE